MGLPDYATHEDQADVMLAKIAEVRSTRVEAVPNWVATPVGQRLAELETKWTVYREASPADRVQRPDPWRTERRDTDDTKALGAALSETHAKLKRISDAKAQLEHWSVFLPSSETDERASYRMREEIYDEMRADLPPWLDASGNCGCRAHESCGRGCPNYLRGAQAAWCATRAPGRAAAVGSGPHTAGPTSSSSRLDLRCSRVSPPLTSSHLPSPSLPDQ